MHPASQAAIALVNNKGDIGRTLKTLGRSSTVKAMVSSALTAGVLEKVGQIPGMDTLKNGTEFQQKLAFNLVNAGGSAVVNTAVHGGSLEDSLKTALVGAFVTTVHGEAASQIKLLEDHQILHKLAHAATCCAAAAAQSQACRDGAIGAAVGEIVAGMMPPANGLAYSPEERDRVLNLSKLVAGGVTAYAGGDVQSGIGAADTAVQNNALVPVLIGLAWLADKAWTAYEVGQDVAAIRDGTKTVDQVAKEKGEEYVTGIILGNVGRYGVKAVKTAAGRWEQHKDPLSNVMESRSTNHLLAKSFHLAERAELHEKSIHKFGTPGERVAYIKQAAEEAAMIHGFIKDNALSKLNNRTVYRSKDNKVYSLDTQHGTFELINSKTGKHEGEVRLFDLREVPRSLDKSGKHDLKVK